ncbi:oligosaccharide flippase family protein [Bradyrhizobium japonicum]|uniref:oligosaccharide flippase family protein n=1 Tax=Bradyrhizobium japonicum TaxID=375 RepID=UPI001BA78B17|nr:oligosaccharide flippase family protein [Bradyrhizobium japonicum]MBR0995458.1 oligosaccharide flippase family protein [Bradyrhizobium japonicum]
MRTLKSRVIAATAWGAASQSASQALRFFLNIFLTHILAPDLFGLTAVANVVMIGIAMVSDIGLGPSIIRSSRGTETSFRNTAYTIQVLRGAITCMIAVAVAASIELFGRNGIASANSVYADPRLPVVIFALSATALIAGFTSTKVHEARRSLLVGRLTVNEILAQIGGILAILVWLWFDRSIWALVAGSIFNSIAAVLLSHTNLPGESNRFRWEHSAATELLRFGAWIFLSSLLSFTATNCDRLLLGGLVSSETLGVYSVAYGLFSTIEQLAARLIATILFPALSETAREKPSQLSAVHYRIYRPAAALMYTLAGTLVMCAPELVRLCYDHRYQQAGLMLQILALALIGVPSQITMQLFIAKGEAQLAALILFGRTLFLFPATLFGFYFWGLSGAVAGISASFVLMLPLTWLISARKGLLRPKKEMQPFLGFLVGLGAGKGLAFLLGLISF